ncbi:hypothetical protein J2M53_15405 [Arthrobacter sp. zg-ZUI100]|uniref:hypothetical protein n=1 Tax=Arthrobacter jiangjiafuii TaxID=2817475 RepID=UPI001AEDD9D8|nr:hypothetical protein [Arthrobacter jiangjiafuii]MBP3037632.1 hypothetical protein [Arthrobacter jiangjiafuii]
MPRRTKTNTNNPGRRSASGRRLGAVLITAGLIATTSCTQNSEPEPVSNPVKLLQSVHVGLSPAAGVQTVQGTTISVAADGASSAEDTTYDAAEVVGELPVRVSLQYRAGEKSGSDLTDLQGHTGPVEINLTLENLTVKPQVIQYDAAGQSRSETALVGAPLTIAASTTLPGVRADDITPGSADGATGTNGVLSSTADGATVVQWATVLAPPRSGASTTLRLVADVKDFQAPSFDMAVQPGLNTDMSADGVVAGAFSSGSGSEMELQQRTISLVSDVNTVLIKAGSTITEVRQNLQEASQTLGVRTAEELRDNSEALAATMSSLKEQLTALGADLEGATNATQSTTMSQLQQTVSAVDSMLGDTSAVPRTAQITGDGCEATVAKPEQGATVYSNVLTMASQLDAYATVSEDCRDFVAGQITVAIGPEAPTEEVCEAEAAEAAQGLADISMTCSLKGSELIIAGALAGLVKEGEELVSSLQPEIVEKAQKDHADSAAALDEASIKIAEILKGAETSEGYDSALANVRETTRLAKESLDVTGEASKQARESIEGLRKELIGFADDAQTELGGIKQPAGSMTQQNQKLADELCKIVDDGSHKEGMLPAEQVAQLRSYLTADPCVPKDAEGKPTPPLKLPIGSGFSGPLDVRLNAQMAAWTNVITAANTAAPNGAIGTALAAVDAAVKDNYDKLKAIDAAVTVLDDAATTEVTGTHRELVALNVALKSAVDSSALVGETLTDLKTQQDNLAVQIRESLEDVETETAKKVEEAIDVQVRKVSNIGNNSSESVVTAFNTSIAGLKTTSDEVVVDAKGTVDKQRGELNERSGALAAALAESTESSLAAIAANTSGSTQDVEGANALLAASLNKVMLDLGDRSVNGSGLLGSMATSAAKADTADYQLALAAQNTEGYGNIRSRDVAGLLLRQAQFKASLAAIDELPAFHLEVPAGATSQTLYTLKIGGGE